MSGRDDRRCRGGRGQATVEVALVLPVVALLALAVVQVGLLVHDQLLVTAATREAVRAAAVSTDPQAPTRAAHATGGLDPARLDIQIEGPPSSGGPVRARAVYRAPTDLPLIGALLPDVRLTAEAVMQSET